MLKKENEKVKQEMALVHVELKKEIKELKDENEKLEVELGEKDAHIYSLHSATKLELQTLPIKISLSFFAQVFKFPVSSTQSAVTHFYTSKHGHHFSARLFNIISSKKYLALAFHPGIFDRMNKRLQVPQIFAKYRDGAQGIPLIEDFNKLVKCDVYTLENIHPAELYSHPAVLTQEIEMAEIGPFSLSLTVTLFMK